MYGNKSLCNQLPTRIQPEGLDFRVKLGCPQGRLLSPFFWNLVIVDLPNYSVNLIPDYLQALAENLITLAEGDDTNITRG